MTFMKNTIFWVVLFLQGCGGPDFTAATDMVETIVDGSKEEADNKSCRRILFGENTGGVVCGTLGPPVLYLCQPAAVPIDTTCMQPDRAEPRYWCCDG